MTDQTTLSGTCIRGGVEYLSFPPPTTLFKAMELRFAERFLRFGEMKFGSLEEYRAWENSALGDPDEGSGIYRVGKNCYETGSVNPIYVWCASDNQASGARIMRNSTEAKYDCVVRIRDPLVLIERVQSAVMECVKMLRLHCSPITYDRGDLVTEPRLNKQPYLFNAFQKKACYSTDSEYRMALVDVGLRSSRESYLLLSVGTCADIAALEQLPSLESSS